MKKKIGLMLAVGALACAGVVHAQTAPSGGTSARSGSTGMTGNYAMPYEGRFWNYIGGSIGRSDYDAACIGPFSCDTRETGFKVYTGGKFHESFGVELGYVHLGNVQLGSGGDSRAHGVNLSLVGSIPVGQSVSLNGKLGTTYGWTKIDGVGPFVGKDNGFGLSYGVGAALGIARNVDLRLDWDRYRFDFAGRGTNDVDLYTVGVQMKF
jgi:OOP family OmpA-OmpF porin